jgi:NTE family protein
VHAALSIELKMKKRMNDCFDMFPSRYPRIRRSYRLSASILTTRFLCQMAHGAEMRIRRFTERFLSIGILGLVMLAGEASAQEALVLSGGGSRGLAHVGVVAGIDSAGRDPDLVIGVSMGAIVGALYASGYTSQQIWRIAADQDWRDIFKPMPLVLGPQRSIRLSTVHWSIDLGRFELSRGFLADWRINRRLVEYLFDAEARTRGNFDLLPRRYRTVAAMRSDGSPVIIAGGDLARAVRASMAEPGVFSPIRLNGEVLIDGGIADYMPVGLAKSFGVKSVIASDVIRSELAGTSNSPIDLLQRALALLVIRARQDTTVPTYLIVPEIDPKQSSLIYPDNVEPLLQLGLAAALRTLPPNSSRPITRRVPRPAPQRLSRLVIETPDSSLSMLARSVFRAAAPAPYSANAVIAAVDRMYATGFTESVWPRVDSSDALIVHIDPRSNASLDVAVGYDNDRDARIWTSAQRRFSGIGAPSEIELAGALTTTDKWASFTARRASVALPPFNWAASASYKKAEARFVRNDGDLSTRDVTRAGGWIGAERRHVFPDWIATASLHAERIATHERREVSYGPLLKIGVPEPGRVVGVPFALSLEQRFGGWSYGRAAARGSLRSDRHHFQFAAVADGAITNSDAPFDVLPALGDDRAMPGMRWGEERGRARIVGGIDIAYPVMLGGHLRIRSRAGAAPLRLRDFDSSHSWVLGTEVGGMWSLPIGSILVAGGLNGRGKARFDIVAGELF